MYHFDEQELIRLYQEGWSVSALAKKFHVTFAVIKLRLIKCEVTLRTPQESTRLAYQIDPSLRERQVQTRRKYPVNEQFFDTLTADSSYIIGLIQADGNLYVKRFRICITLKPSDADFLLRIAQRMGADRPLIDAKSPFGPGVYLGIYSRPLVTALQHWGIQSPKSHTASTHPALLLNRDYWRGVIDGDGTLYLSSSGYKILSLVGSKNICEEFLAFCRHHTCGHGVTVRPHKNIFSVRLSSTEAIKIATVLYDGADLALDRKRIIYLEKFLPEGLQ